MFPMEMSTQGNNNNTWEVYYMPGTVQSTSYLLNSQTTPWVGIITTNCEWWIWATEKLSPSHVSGGAGI